MPYTPPITDRTRADVIAKNSKAYINVSDLTRIYNNSLEVHDLLESALGYNIPFTAVTLPTTLTNPTTLWTLVGIILTDINNIIISVSSWNLSGVRQIKKDWERGKHVLAINYAHVNSWELILDILYVYFNGTMNRYQFPRTGVAISGAGSLRNNMFRSY